MKITINQFRVALLTNLLVIGLAGCASTPAPWSRPDTSPWQGKDSATTSSSSTTTSEDQVNPAPEPSTPAAEPLPATDNTMSPPPAEAAGTEPAPAPMSPPPAEAQPSQTAQPSPMPAPPTESAAKPVAAAVSNEQQIMDMSNSYYAVQAYAATTMASVKHYKAKHHLDNMMAVKTARGSKTFYVLVETFPTRSAANAAAKDVKKATGSNPWVRSVAGLKKVVQQ